MAGFLAIAARVTHINAIFVLEGRTLGEGQPMDRNDYEIVLAVAGLGSVPAAARALGLDALAARQRLDGLESRKGVALFSHGPQGSTPTPVGLRLAMLAQSMKIPTENLGGASWPATAAVAGRVRVMADSAMTA